MKFILSSLLLLSLLNTSVAQDTTWVQTFTFDSIATRRANFAFPAALNDMRFEKVLMYYKLKCSPLTPWDQYNCGEWDYLAYTQVHEHTGLFDSVEVLGNQYLMNYLAAPSYTYDPLASLRVDTFHVQEQGRNGFATTPYAINMTPGTATSMPFDQSKKGGRFQMLITAAELTAAGIMAGDLQSLTLYVSSITGNGDLLHPLIAIKGTNDNTLTAFHESGFTAVYDLSRWSSGAASPLSPGANEFQFHAPFNWNGSENIIIEYSFQDGVNNGNSTSYETENTATNQALHYKGKNGQLRLSGTEHALMELSDLDLGNELSIAFWAKGSGNSGVNTSILEGYDTLGNRIVNIHMPWSNNRIYWDCGTGSGYDRIDKAMTALEIDNEWHHWTFVKDQTTGSMKIYKDGALWHSGTGLNLPAGYLHRLVIGANKDLTNHWKGWIDEFMLFNVALDETTILNWYKKKADPSHPNWTNILTYYDFDEEEWAVDLSGNDYLLMPSVAGLIGNDTYPVAGAPYPVSGIKTANRPLIALGQGTVSGPAFTTSTPYISPKEPEVVFEFAEVNHHFEISNAFLAVPSDSENTYDENGTQIGSVSFVGQNSITNQQINYFEEAFEVINNVEIGRFITPYGIQFDLGPNGFTWIYDVTDYQMYLHDLVDLSAHNTQELIDLKFAFIEGIPPRDVHARQPVWSDFNSYTYSAMDNDLVLSATPIALEDTSSMFKIKSRFTGHGHNGSVNCCEWDSKDHSILVDGIERFNWEIWEETACGDNPNVSQGGTWPYAREGWCPGDLVKEYDHELTPYVTPGSTVTLDYDIEDVPAGDLAQGNGNYVVAMDLISYSAPNFQNDAALIDILNPNGWEYYRKWNPSCQNPRVIIQNTGEQPLTSCKIVVWVDNNVKQEFVWTGNLAFLEKEIVEIPIPYHTFWYDYYSSGTFTARIDEIQGTAGLDEYPHNDEKTIPFVAPDALNGPFLVWFTTNNKAWENKWRLIDSEGNILFERTSLSSSTQYQDTFDLQPGCYSIILEDNDSDGISFWYSQQYEGETAGTFRIKLVGGIIVKYFEQDFGNYHQYNFTVGFDLGLNEMTDVEDEIRIYPNPNKGIFQVEISGDVDHEADLTVLNLLGQSCYQTKMDAKQNYAEKAVDLSHLPAGHYLVRIRTSNGVFVEEFIKQ